REAGTRVISLDPNVRPRVVGDLGAYRERFERLLTQATIVKASDEDIELLYPSKDMATAAKDWLTKGPELVIITRGAKGPLAAFKDSVVERPSPSIDVVDTVGAGDTFHAALLAWFDAKSQLTLEAISTLTEDQVTAALDFASTAAAIVCTKRGANPPSWDEVMRFKAERP
ncbi:MAG: PfkB family carbohydrate kinase, partial [Microvirga sp.]